METAKLIDLKSRSAVQLAISKNVSSMKPFLRALDEPRINEISEKEVILKKVVGSAVAKANLLLNLTPKTELEFSVLCTSIMEVIERRFAVLTAAEIALAFDHGVESYYCGDIRGLNFPQIVFWLEKFRNHPYRHQAIKALKASREDLVVEKIERKVDYERWLRFAFSEYEKNGKYEDFGNKIYDFLHSRGAISFSVEEKQEIKNIVRGQLLAKNSAPKSRLERNLVRERVQEIENGGHVFSVACKHYALNLFFRNLVENGRDIESVLNNF